MNKKILAVSILMLMMCAMAASVFADDDGPKEYEWKVVVNYQNGSGKWLEKSYTIWAKTSREAEAKALELCEFDARKENGKVGSCGGANATGRSRPAN